MKRYDWSSTASHLRRAITFFPLVSHSHDVKRIHGFFQPKRQGNFHSVVLPVFRYRGTFRKRTMTFEGTNSQKKKTS